jgi:hypothetical protein
MSKTSMYAASALAIAVVGFMSTASADQHAVEHQPSLVSVPHAPLPSDNVDGLNSRDWDQVKKDIEKIIHDRLNRGLPPIPCFRSPIGPRIDDGCRPSAPKLVF